MTDAQEPRHRASGPANREGARPSVDEARAVETVVVAERGQWAVDIVVFFDDQIVRKRIDTYRTERLATISADLIKRTAERDLPGPLNG